MGVGKVDSCLKNQDLKQLEDLFKRLDVNKDGKLCSSDLMHALKSHHRLKNREDLFALAEEFLSRCGIRKDGQLDFVEFMNYAVEHDKRLIEKFSHLDYSNSGIVRAEDVKAAFTECGIPVETEEAERLVRHVDKTGNFHIDYEEWRDFLLFHSADDMSSILTYWRYCGRVDPLREVELQATLDDTIMSEQTIISSKQSLQLLSGAIAGATSRTLTAPIDRLKVMRQVHGYKHKGTGFTDAYRYMIREGGLSSLFRGNGINVLKMAPETALKFTSYEHYKQMLVNPKNQWLSEQFQTRPLLTQFAAGSLAGSTAQTIIYPLEVLKTRMCLRKTGQYHSMWHCARSIYRDTGLSAFYRGYLVNLIGIIPYAGIELTLYEMLKSTYIHRFMLSEAQRNAGPVGNEPHLLRPPTLAIPFMAASASACGIVATYPISLVRAKLQATIYSHRTQQKVTAKMLVSTILREDGFTGLYRGMLTSLMKVLPAVGISLTSYEILRREFDLGPMGSG